MQLAVTWKRLSSFYWLRLVPLVICHEQKWQAQRIQNLSQPPARLAEQEGTVHLPVWSGALLLYAGWSCTVPRYSSLLKLECTHLSPTRQLATFVANAMKSTLAIGRIVCRIPRCHRRTCSLASRGSP